MIVPSFLSAICGRTMRASQRFARMLQSTIFWKAPSSIVVIGP